MKTDLEKFKELYDSLDVPYECSETDTEIFMYIGDHSYQTGTTSYSEKLEGYSGFYSKIHFSKYGKFLTQGFWE